MKFFPLYGIIPINEIKKIIGSTKIAINFWFMILSLIKINNITIELIHNKIPKNISIIINIIPNLEIILLIFCSFIFLSISLLFSSTIFWRVFLLKFEFLNSEIVTFVK